MPSPHARPLTLCLSLPTAFYVTISLAGLLSLGAALSTIATVREAHGLMAAVSSVCCQMAPASSLRQGQELERNKPGELPDPSRSNQKEAEVRGQASVSPSTYTVSTSHLSNQDPPTRARQEPPPGLFRSLHGAPCHPVFLRSNNGSSGPLKESWPSQPWGHLQRPQQGLALVSCWVWTQDRMNSASH